MTVDICRSLMVMSKFETESNFDQDNNTDLRGAILSAGVGGRLASSKNGVHAEVPRPKFLITDILAQHNKSLGRKSPSGEIQSTAVSDAFGKNSIQRHFDEDEESNPDEGSVQDDGKRNKQLFN